MTKKRSPQGIIEARFMRRDCVIELGQYPGNGRMKVTLLDKKTGIEMAIATVELPSAPLGPNEVFILDWTENGEILQSLQEAGVARITGESVHGPSCTITKCRLLLDVPGRIPDGTLAIRAPAQTCAKQAERDAG